MNREQVEKLLGGYSTGTLTPEEQQALFEAALADQQLFDALAREQALRDLLRDPASKAQVLAALDARRPRWYERLSGWRPLAAVAALAAVAVVAVILVRPKAELRQPDLAQVVAPKAPPPPEFPARPEPKPEVPRTHAAKKAPILLDKNVPQGSTIRVTPPSPPSVRAAEAAATPPQKVAEEDATAKKTRAETVSVNGAAAALPVNASAPGTALDALSARDLFYRQQFVQSQTGAAPPQAPEPKQQPSPSQQQQLTMAREQEQRLRYQMATGALDGAAQRPSNPGVRYLVLRKSETGDFAVTDPSALKDGDIVELRFETNDNGYLSLTAAGKESRTIYAGRIVAHSPYTTQPLRPEEREVHVEFSRAPAVTIARTAAVETSNRVQQAAGERATYVVGNQASAPVRFTIKLDYK